MSRIDAALNRAKQQDNRTTAGGPGRLDDPARDDAVASDVPPNVFVAPWTFGAHPRTSGGNGHRPEAAVVTAAGSAGLFHGFADDVRERLVVGRHDANKTAMAVSVEQYRKLAATLHHAQIERDIKVVMLTSAIAGEGKTLTATNLALTLSESYRRRVLLVDADLRRPALHQVFQVPGDSGLSDGLRAGERTLSLFEITPQLTLLPAGQPDPDPMGVLTSEKMRRIIEEASARFDWVIVDAPPVGLLTDANLLGKMVDAVLIVVQAGKTAYPFVQKAVEAVGRDRVLGVVLNRVNLPDGTYGYKYDEYYAGYYAPKKE
jgi:capsular exopolysaccharide synthesis family protein